MKRNPDRLSLYVLAAAACVAIYSPIYLVRSDLSAWDSPARSAKARAVELVPLGAPVSASNELGGHLSARRYSAIFPTVGRATWVVIDRADPTYGDTAGYRRAVHEIESSPSWLLQYSSHDVVVLRKRAPDH
jgi:hypothetical protein